jgi:hypothetical protein
MISYLKVTIVPSGIASIKYLPIFKNNIQYATVEHFLWHFLEYYEYKPIRYSHQIQDPLSDLS